MEKETKLMDSLQVVCFKVGTEEYGIEILKVQEILKLPKVTKLPKSAAFIMGVIDLRGKVIPIINLSRRFSHETKVAPTDQRAIVVDIKGRQIGLAIDTVSHVVKFEAGNIEPAPPILKGISGRYIIGVAKHNNGYVIILDIDKIFSSEELNLIAS